MRAHRTNVTVSDSHQLLLDLPDDFPPGPVEVIVLAEAPMTRNVVRLEGVLNSSDSQLEGDPIEESLRELREERGELLEQRAMGYTPGPTDVR